MKKGRCKGGKYAKQRITVLLIVNALSEKEPPIITGRSLKLRCFKNVKDKRHPLWLLLLCKQKSLDGFRAYGRNFKNLRRKCASEDREILLFIDNAPNHPEIFYWLFFPCQNCLRAKECNIQIAAT